MFEYFYLCTLKYWTIIVIEKLNLKVGMIGSKSNNFYVLKIRLVVYALKKLHSFITLKFT